MSGPHHPGSAMRGPLARQAVVAIVALLVGLGLGRGCRWLGDRFPAGPPEAAPAGSAEAARPRIISLSPGLTECVYALGLEDHLVGVSQFTVWPERAARLPQVGGWINPNEELILKLKPDVVLLQGEYAAFQAFADRWHLPVENLSMARVPDILAAIRRIAVLAGRAQAGETESKLIALELEQIRQAVAGRARPRVFLCIGREPEALRNMYTVSRDSFLNDLIETAGGVNVFADLAREYPAVSLEAVTAAAPDVVIDVRPGEAMPPERRAALIAEWGALPAPAVRAGRVHVLNEDGLMIPGPRIPDTARVLARCVHPEVRLPGRPQ